MFQANNYQPGELVSILRPIQNYYGTYSPPHTFTVVRIEEGQPGQGIYYGLTDEQGNLVWASADNLMRARR